MNIVWGSIMAVIGAYLLVFSLIAQICKREIVPYKWLAAKSRILWKGFTHYFYMVVGSIITTLGVLWASGIIFK